jgi:hypothetical protein
MLFIIMFQMKKEDYKIDWNNPIVFSPSPLAHS